MKHSFLIRKILSHYCGKEYDSTDYFCRNLIVPLSVIIVIVIWLLVAIVLAVEFYILYIKIFYGFPTFHGCYVILLETFSVISITIFISERYRWYGVDLPLLSMIWPIIVFFLPFIIMKFERDRKLKMIRDVMEL